MKAHAKKPGVTARAKKPGPVEDLEPSRNLVTGGSDKTVPLPVRMHATKYFRLRQLAARSGITVERWLDSVIAAGIAADEAHWREVGDLEQLRREVDPASFGRLSIQLRNLRHGVLDLLVQKEATARHLGREEGRRMAARCGLAPRSWLGDDR